MSGRDNRGPGELSIGVDVGGTNTDAVVLDATGVLLASEKRPTTPEVTEGIRASLRGILDGLGDDRGRISRVMLGTTHATNAIARRRGLGRVAVVRLGAPATTEFPPLLGWPDDLRDAIVAGAGVVGGGHMIDGYPIAPLDRDGIRHLLDDASGHLDAVAVTGVFSPSSPDQEVEVAGLVREHLGPEVPVSLSHEIGATGLLERENATVLNAALYGVARDVTTALLDAVAEERLDAQCFFAQNDGTLMSLDHAARHPVLTIGSGPANSIRGAAFLSGATHAIVLDVGGTTSDLGVVVDGFPRESMLPRDIGGVRTNFRMPDVLSVALGGGTVVDLPTARPSVESVGFRITSESLLFGGTTPTLTDAVALVDGSPIEGRALPRLDRSTDLALAGALEVARDRIESAVELMSLGRGDLPLVVVGGGGFLVPDAVLGASEVIRLEHGAVANAVGAAIALVGGRAEVVAAQADRADAIAEASMAAIRQAVAAGADPAGVAIVEVAETPVAYAATPTVKVAVKAAGPLA